MPQARKIKNEPKPLLPKFCYVCSPDFCCTMYTGPIQRALKKKQPRARSWRVLEDNDPTGSKSKAGEAAKRAAGIQVFSIPKRSPQLNVCDYALWTEINKRMRRQERRWPAGKNETRTAYRKRLRLTALRISKAFINKSISNKRVRCKRLLAARGRHFEEGGNWLPTSCEVA